MCSQPVSSDINVLRPGLLAGHYPVRNDQEPDWMERFVRTLLGGVDRMRFRPFAGFSEVISGVEHYGEVFARLSTTQLEKQVVDLRRQFNIHGLTTPLCLQSFALIRELSGRTIGMRHYDTQIMAGWVILKGMLAEMDTGEGKTLAATLPAGTTALAGIPTHIITVNQYLVQRDAELMRPLYEALHLEVGYVTADMSDEQRQAAYTCPVTYCTNKQVAFDHLRDRLQLSHSESRLRIQLKSAFEQGNSLKGCLLQGLCFAIVDEADSVLIDEARTPLILTCDSPGNSMNNLCLKALDMAKKFRQGEDFFIDTTCKSVELSRVGQQKLRDPDFAGRIPGQNERRRQELVCLALHALHLLHRDRDYLVRDNRVLIIDPNTGRIMPDRSWERGLQQMVEAKEGCTITEVRQTLGRLTYQRFFRRYLRLGGMTGTAREVSSELWSVYGLRVRQIPLRCRSRRHRLPARIFSRAEDKWAAVVSAVKDMQQSDRPVLIGTGSVAESEELSHRLAQAGIFHRVLNARQDRKEAQIIAEAGRARQVTVATNMAGRGTDIRLNPEAVKAGGLHVIATCCNEARRIDRQLFGRCARRGEPGSCQYILSMEDDLIKDNCPALLLGLLRRYSKAMGQRSVPLCMFMIRLVQKRVENRHRQVRQALLRYDRRNSRVLAFSGDLE